MIHSRRPVLPCTPSRSPAVLALFVWIGGCTAAESKYDVYMEGLQVEGKAERGPCKLSFDGGAKAQVMSGDKVQECLAQQQLALALYEKAKGLGMDVDVEFMRTYEKAQERVMKLEAMLKQIRQMERD